MVCVSATHNTASAAVVKRLSTQRTSIKVIIEIINQLTLGVSQQQIVVVSMAIA